jgi:arylsulfatase A-like enzyme
MKALLKTSGCVAMSLIASIHGYSKIKNVINHQRPNIIFILTDDQRFDALGVAGNSLIQTPNMDKLARGGVLFENAYVTTSISCVSRASIFTGQYESKHHINAFSTNFTPEALRETYPVLLKNAGYKIGFIGKFGVGNNPPDSIFDYCFDTEAGGLSQPNYIMIGKNGKKIHDTDTIASSIHAFLDQYVDKGPFCLSVSFKAPHEQDGNPPTYVIQPKYKNYYKNAMFPLPVTANPKYWNDFPDFFRTDTNFARARWKGLFGTPELYQENVRKYYQLVTGVDDVIGEMMDQLKELGIDKNTVIFIMGDNGMMLGEHGMEGKWFGYEESIRVPLILYDPQLPDKVTQYKAPQIALNIDIAPTILSLAGIPVPKTMQGFNLINIIEDKIDERKDFFHQFYYLGGSRLPREEGVVTKGFKYMNYIEHNYEELFDIKYDPHETTNLVNDPKYKNELIKLRNRYHTLKQKYGEPRSEWASGF